MNVSGRFHSLPHRDASNAPAREQSEIYERWLAFLSQHLFTYNMSSRKEPGFQINAHSRVVDGFTLARFTTVKGASDLSRGPNEINVDDRDGYVVYMPVKGRLTLSQFGRSQSCGPYTSVLLSTSERLSHTKFGDNDTLCFLMPRGFVERRTMHVEDLCARPPKAPGEGVRRLFADTLVAFERDADTMTDLEFGTVARLLGELSLLSVGGSLDVASSLHSVRASNLARAKRIIRRRLGDPDLSPAAVAKDCGISVRYLHVLFQQDGLTVREYLTQLRMREARRMLEASADNGTTVTEVSLRCGFGSPSQFSTAFRRAFGLSPRDVMRGG